jgi:hypothetical protein
LLLYPITTGSTGQALSLLLRTDSLVLSFSLYGARGASGVAAHDPRVDFAGHVSANAPLFCYLRRVGLGRRGSLSFFTTRDERIWGTGSNVEFVSHWSLALDADAALRVFGNGRTRFKQWGGDEWTRALQKRSPKPLTRHKSGPRGVYPRVVPSWSNTACKPQVGMPFC